MAVSNLTEVYESLYLINNLTDQLIFHLERLGLANILAPEVVKIRQATARELRSTVMASSAMKLDPIEVQAAFQQQRERLELEKKLA